MHGQWQGPLCIKQDTHNVWDSAGTKLSKTFNQDYLLLEILKIFRLYSPVLLGQVVIAPINRTITSPVVRLTTNDWEINEKIIEILLQ